MPRASARLQDQRLQRSSSTRRNLAHKHIESTHKTRSVRNLKSRTFSGNFSSQDQLSLMRSHACFLTSTLTSMLSKLAGPHVLVQFHAACHTCHMLVLRFLALMKGPPSILVGSFHLFAAKCELQFGKQMICGGTARREATGQESTQRREEIESMCWGQRQVQAHDLTEKTNEPQKQHVCVDCVLTLSVCVCVRVCVCVCMCAVVCVYIYINMYTRKVCDDVDDGAEGMSLCLSCT